MNYRRGGESEPTVSAKSIERRLTLSTEASARREHLPSPLDTFVDETSHVLSLLPRHDKFQKFDTPIERLQFLGSESRPERKMKITRRLAYFVLALTCWLVQQG